MLSPSSKRCKRELTAVLGPFRVREPIPRVSPCFAGCRFKLICASASLVLALVDSARRLQEGADANLHLVSGPFECASMLLRSHLVPQVPLKLICASASLVLCCVGPQQEPGCSVHSHVLRAVEQSCFGGPDTFKHCFVGLDFDSLRFERTITSKS